MRIPQDCVRARAIGKAFRTLLGISSFFFAVWAPAATPAASATGDDPIERRIQRIQDAIAPAVLVQGESPPQVTLQERMTALHVPGVSIAVIHGGKIEWARGFGVIRLGGPPVTARTLFQAASASKPVTALAALHLAQVGQLDLDSDVNRYLKRWKIPANSFTDQHPVTLRELLSHTAGITVHGFSGYASGTPLPTLTQVLNGQPPANSAAIRVDATPGARWRYSGGGYVVIQELLEDVTGKPFAEVMQQTVLQPIGMSDSTYEQPLMTSRLEAVAIPYNSAGDPVSGGPHVYPERAPAGLWTTPSDLARYAIEVQRAIAGQSNGVLTAEMTHTMLTPGLNDWGLGPQVGGAKSHPYFEHSGANVGYRCELVAYESGDGAVIMTNGDNGGPLTEEILRTIAREYNWPDFQPPVRTIAKVDTKTLDSLAGTYELGPHLELSFWREGDRFIAQATGGGRFEVFPQNDHEFFAKVVNALITFNVNDQGRASGLVLHQNGQSMSARRLGDLAAKAKAMQTQLPVLVVPFLIAAALVMWSGRRLWKGQR